MSVPAAEPRPGLVPPIRQMVTVHGDRDRAYDAFVRRIGRWWPTVPLSLGGGRVRAVRVEPRLGGRVYEVWADGTEADWGEVLVWEPPGRFAMTWEATALTAEDGELRRVDGGAVTEVEVRFVTLGPALTAVELEHRGWERLRPASPDACTAAWDLLLTRLATHLT